MHNELERFVEVDEKVRQDLDRKGEVDYIREKNNEEIQRSAAKVRNSQSPVRQGSPYRSPKKY